MLTQPKKMLTIVKTMVDSREQLIDLCCEVEDHPPNLDQGGAWSYFSTLRPRDYDDAPPDFESSVISRIRAESVYHIIVKENDNHLHCCSFLYKTQSRYNYSVGWYNAADSPCAFFDEQERTNLRKAHKNKAKAIENITTTDVISSYLSGEYATKIDKPFEILSAKLPADLSELEFWIPDVGALKGPKYYNPDIRRQVNMFKADNLHLYADPKDRYPIEEVEFIDIQAWHNLKTHDFLLPSCRKRKDHDDHIADLMHHINRMHSSDVRVYHCPHDPQFVPDKGHPAWVHNMCPHTGRVL